MCKSCQHKKDWIKSGNVFKCEKYGKTLHIDDGKCFECQQAEEKRKKAEETK